MEGISIRDHFWVFIKATGKEEIAICKEVDRNRFSHQGIYKFVYSHWSYNGYNFLTEQYINEMGMRPFTKVDYILYGRKDI